MSIEQAFRVTQLKITPDTTLGEIIGAGFDELDQAGSARGCARRDPLLRLWRSSEAESLTFRKPNSLPLRPHQVLVSEFLEILT